ncbi:MAG: cyclic pyranopterin monophosphate synthase MoaC, partial [Candidatus Puniceispirillum sp.]
MVDVGAKTATARTAIVKGHVKMQPDTLAMIQRGDAKKG